MGNQGGSISTDINSSTTGCLKLGANTVLACRWQLLKVDETTGTLEVDYQIAKEKGNAQMMYIFYDQIC